MAKTKRNQEVEPVAQVATTPGEVPEVPAVPVVEPGSVFVQPVIPSLDEGPSPLLTIYSALLASVDWQRDVRKPITICRQSFKIAKLALEVFEANQKMEMSE